MYIFWLMHRQPYCIRKRGCVPSISKARFPERPGCTGLEGNPRGRSGILHRSRLGGAPWEAKGKPGRWPWLCQHGATGSAQGHWNSWRVSTSWGWSESQGWWYLTWNAPTHLPWTCHQPTGADKWILFRFTLISLQNYVLFCSLTKPCLTLCNLMDCSTPGFPVFHHLPEFAHTHVHWVSDAIQPSHSLSPPSPHALNLS